MIIFLIELEDRAPIDGADMREAEKINICNPSFKKLMQTIFTCLSSNFDTFQNYNSLISK